jgi:hypothetical protein
MAGTAEELIKIYQAAQYRLINILIKTPEQMGAYKYKKILLRQVNTELKRLQAESQKWVKSSVPLIYEKNQRKAVKQLLKLKHIPPKEVLRASFARIHKEAVKVIAENSYNDLFGAINQIGRSLKDEIRDAGIAAAGEGLTTGLTPVQVQNSLKDSLLSQNILSIPTQSGRTFSIDAYSALVSRSTVREATNQGTMNQLVSLGEDLVKMSSHNSPCEICAQYEGRIYSISGNSHDFPSLKETAFSGGYANIHPNCKHVLEPYVIGLSGNFQEDLEFSNRPFEDNRSQADIDRYNEQQKKNRILLQDKKQFEKYKMALGPDGPKTFSSFRNIKNNNPKKYQEYKSLYRSKKSALMPEK